MTKSIYEQTTGWPLPKELGVLSTDEMVEGVRKALDRPEDEHWRATAAMLCDRLLAIEQFLIGAETEIRRLRAGDPGLSPSESVRDLVAMIVGGGPVKRPTAKARRALKLRDARVRRAIKGMAALLGQRTEKP